MYDKLSHSSLKKKTVCTHFKYTHVRGKHASKMLVAVSVDNSVVVPAAYAVSFVWHMSSVDCWRGLGPKCEYSQKGMEELISFELRIDI